MGVFKAESNPVKTSFQRSTKHETPHHGWHRSRGAYPSEDFITHEFSLSHIRKGHRGSGEYSYRFNQNGLSRGPRHRSYRKLYAEKPDCYLFSAGNYNLLVDQLDFVAVASPLGSHTTLAEKRPLVKQLIGRKTPDGFFKVQGPFNNPNV